MPKTMSINLPITDLVRSTAFYEAVGGTRRAKFPDDTAACMVFSESIQAMLQTHDTYRQVASTPMADTHGTSAALIALTVESRDEVNATIDRAVASGGRADPNPRQDHGFMFGRSVQDPDGHVWEVLWMDPATAGGSALAADQDCTLKIGYLFAAMFVSNLEASEAFYTKVLGREPDDRPADRLIQWRGVSNAGIRLFEDTAKAGRSTMTIVVADIERTKRFLNVHGIDLGQTLQGDFGRIVQLGDPDKNSITFAEPPRLSVKHA